MTKKRYTFKVVNPETGWVVTQNSTSPTGGFTSWKKYWFRYDDVPPHLFGFTIDNELDKVVGRLENGRYYLVKEEQE